MLHVMMFLFLQFNLVCERGYLRATYQSIYMSATIFSSVAGGYIADRYMINRFLVNAIIVIIRENRNNEYI